MPDISMCLDHGCPSRMKCHRYTAIPSDFWQAYSDFKHDETGRCAMFWPNDGWPMRKEVLS